MRVEIKKESSLTVARKWEEIFEDERIPVGILPKNGDRNGAYSVGIPKDKEYVIQEILRQL
jgi:hypothetical protein